MPTRTSRDIARRQKAKPQDQRGHGRYPRNARGRQVCVAVTKSGISLYGNRQAFQTLASWMKWLADAEPADHDECHMMWHFSLPPLGKRQPAVWFLFDRETGVAFSKSGRRQFDVTFMVVENSDLSQLSDPKLSGTLPAAWGADASDSIKSLKRSMAARSQKRT